MSKISRLKEAIRKFRKFRKTIGSVEDTLDATETIEADVSLARDTAEDAESMTDIASDVLSTAAEIPTPVTEELKPVATGVGAIHSALKKPVVPALKSVASLLGTVLVLLAPIAGILKASKDKNDGLAKSFDNAESVHDQILAKYPDGAPDAMKTPTNNLETALAQVDDALGSFEKAIDEIGSALKPLDPVQDIAKLLEPVSTAMTPVHNAVHKFLKKNGKLLKGMKRAVNAFKQHGRAALSYIKTALKHAGIDISFIDGINRTIQGLAGQALERLLSPVTHLEQQAKSKLSGLKGPIDTLEGKVTDMMTHAARALDPLKDVLDDYVRAAAKIGIHPR